MKLLKYIYMKMKTKKIRKIRIPYDLFEFYNRDEAKLIKEFLGEPPKFNSPTGELNYPSKNNQHIRKKLYKSSFLKDL